MISLIHRHIFREIILASALSMSLFVFVLLVGNALKDVAELVVAGKLDFWVFIKVLGLFIPYVASFALPLGILTGTLVALGRLSSQREIIAMKSAGMSLYQIAAPVFLIAFVGMLAAVLVNQHYAPNSRLERKALLTKALTENPIGFIEERRFIHEFPGYVIYMGGRDGTTLKDFWIWELDEAKRVKMFLRAKEGEMNYNEVNKELILTLKNGTAEQRDPKNPESFSDNASDSLFFGEFPIALSLEKLFGDERLERVRIKEMTFAQLMILRSAELSREKRMNEPISKERLELQVHIQKNFALAFSVFSLAIFGVPLAIQAGRKETYANFGIALIIAMSYYVLTIILSLFEGNPSLRPDILIWLPNLLFQVVGFWMIHRSSRY
ncbi:MAG: LptF/LptG family permease [Verrucomicrobiota bacterium]|nr:LptF/LptG family permease [Verrucomicrobiota bacterium]MEC8333208.1 LptF/LptG family permease [Verrucomicrobiota bacterium]